MSLSCDLRRENSIISPLAAELVRLKIDIIVSAGLGPTRAVKEATNTIPIVVTNERDPFGTGIVASLARPGGNIAGLSTLARELNEKRLVLLKEAVFGTSAQPGNARMLKEMELAAKLFGMQLQYERFGSQGY